MRLEKILRNTGKTTALAASLFAISYIGGYAAGKAAIDSTYENARCAEAKRITENFAHARLPVKLLFAGMLRAYEEKNTDCVSPH